MATPGQMTVNIPVKVVLAGEAPVPREGGGWIQTYMGNQVWPLSLHREDVFIGDIAHALGNLCRFNGHCRRFYSVAEHSVRVSRILPDDLALWGLMHDAAEAYLGDVTRPVKGLLLVMAGNEGRQLLLKSFRHAETEAMVAIAVACGLVWPMPEAVKHADDVLLATERRDLMCDPPAAWDELPDPLPEPIGEPMPPQYAEQAFLDRYEELTGA